MNIVWESGEKLHEIASQFHEIFLAMAFFANPHQKRTLFFYRL
jgi:hypothetical protein